MKSTKLLTASAVAGLFALSLIGVGSQVQAGDAKVEKCYGIVKAGKNDCKTANGSCAGSSKVDAAGDAYIAVPKGTCEKIVGGSLTPKA